MKARMLKSPAELRAGMVLSRNTGQLDKGTVLGEMELLALRASTWSGLAVLEMEPGDVHEVAAGQRLARAVCGAGVEVQALQAGSWPLAARQRGLLQLDAEKLSGVNDSNDLAVVTAPHGQVVLAGDLVGRAKIVPFVIREEELARVEAIGAALSVKPFVPLRVAALVQEAIDDAGLAEFRAMLDKKLGFFGSRLVSVERGTDVRKALRDGAQLVAMAGTKPMDPLDPGMQALAQAGARIEKSGVPLHPGILLWLASLDGTPIVGAPACAMLAKPTAFDILLPLLMTGGIPSRKELAKLGAGGLLAESRFPPYGRT